MIGARNAVLLRISLGALRGFARMRNVQCNERSRKRRWLPWIASLCWNGCADPTAVMPANERSHSDPKSWKRRGISS